MFKGKGERETKIKVSFTKKTIFKEKREREKSRFSSRRKRSLKEKEREKRIEVFLPKKTIFKGKGERERERKIEVSLPKKRSLKKKERKKRIEVSLPKKRSLKEKERKRKKSRFNCHEAKIVKPNINTGSNDGGNEEE